MDLVDVLVRKFVVIVASAMVAAVLVAPQAPVVGVYEIGEERGLPRVRADIVIEATEWEEGPKSVRQYRVYGIEPERVSEAFRQCGTSAVLVYSEEVLSLPEGDRRHFEMDEVRVEAREGPLPLCVGIKDGHGSALYARGSLGDPNTRTAARRLTQQLVATLKR